MSLPATHAKEQARRCLCGAGVSPALALFALLLSCTLAPAADPPLKDRPHLRRPIAAAWIEPGKLLAVANQRSGTVSIVDIPGRKVLDEIAVGERLADMVGLPGTGRLVVLDDKRHEMIMLTRAEGSWAVEDRMEVTPHPVNIAVSPDGSILSVASLWSRKLSIWQYAKNVPRHEIPYLLRGEVRLPFNPRRQILLPKERQILIADAYGRQIALIATNEPRVVAQALLAGHNIGGIAAGPYPGRIMVSHLLSAPAAASLENLRAQRVVESVVSEYDLSLFATSQRESTLPNHVQPLGDRNGGRGDPGAIRLLQGGRTLVAASGVNELTLLTDDGVSSAQSLPVGGRPSRVAFFDDMYAVYRSPSDPAFDVVLNSFSDSLSLVTWDNGPSLDPTDESAALRKPKPRPIRTDLLLNDKSLGLPGRATSPRVSGEISLGPATARTPAERGEELFYDARLSAGGWMSCHSCHTDGHTSGQLADTLGDGTYGTPKRIPTLLGTRLTDKWAWNGEVRELHEQVQKSLENTMHAPKFTPQDVLDITAFLHTLPPPPPLQPATKAPKDIAQLARGEALFGNLGCAKCHVPPLTYTSPEVFDVDLEDEKGLKKFNPPSLRGVSQGYSFLHDGRAKTLEAVFTKHAHQLNRPLEKGELADLLRFLRSL